MYGLLEAAEQIRQRGRLLPAKGDPPCQSAACDCSSNPRMWRRSGTTPPSSGGATRRCWPAAVSTGLTSCSRNWTPGSATWTRCAPSPTAADYAIDLTLGLRTSADEPGADEVLKQVLAACPAIRSVQVWCRVQFFGPIGEAGRRVTLELRNEGLTPDLLKAATESGAVANRQ